MKVHLMYCDEDFDLQAGPSPNEDELTQDLGLDTLFEAMALGDPFLFVIAQRTILRSLSDRDAIVYRQDVLRDCLEQSTIVRELYDLAVEALVAKKKVWGFFRGSPSSTLHYSVEVLQLLLEQMKALRRIAEEHAAEFQSDGFSKFFAMIASELDDAYLDQVQDHLRRLAFKHGVLISAKLTTGNKGADYVLRQPNAPKPGLKNRISSLTHRSGYSFQLADRDEAGARALEALRSRGLNDVANAATQSVDHILSFLTMLRVELGFYIGALNLKEQLAAKDEPICFPNPTDPGRRELAFQALYDVGLTLRMQQRVIGNDVHADGRSLVMITGANQGGKSTFLRSVGLAQLMMQAGMFVGAQSFRGEVCAGVFTHFKREEDATMTSGKFDEELARMSAIADQLAPNSLMLCNESFAATNEREGSEVALQIIRALIDTGIKVVFVTHMYDLAHRLEDDERVNPLFLRAERQDDGQRTFRLLEGAPLATSYGADVYRRIFATADGTAGASDQNGAPAGDLLAATPQLSRRCDPEEARIA